MTGRKGDRPLPNQSRTDLGPHVQFAERIRMKYATMNRKHPDLPLPSLVWLAVRQPVIYHASSSFIQEKTVHTEVRNFIYRHYTSIATERRSGHAVPDVNHASPYALIGYEAASISSGLSPLQGPFLRGAPSAGLTFTSAESAAKSAAWASRSAARTLGAEVQTLQEASWGSRKAARSLQADERGSGEAARISLAHGKRSGEGEKATARASVLMRDSLIPGRPMPPNLPSVGMLTGSIAPGSDIPMVIGRPSQAAPLMRAAAVRFQAAEAGEQRLQQTDARELVIQGKRQPASLVKDAPELVVAQSAAASAAAARPVSAGPALTSSGTGRAQAPAVDSGAAPAGTPAPLQPVEIERISEQVYRELERRLKIEKQRMGL